jgi:hypothetical protein
MPWATITVSYASYRQNYKRSYSGHNHDAVAAFVVAAKNDSLNRINAGPPVRRPPLGLNQLNTTNVASDLPNDPGVNWRAI